MIVRLLFKIIVVGDGGVGKSTMIQRLTTEQFIPMKITIGTDLISHDVPLSDTETAKLQIWDFGGEKRFRFLLPKFCLGARGAMLAFDLNRFSTFLKLDQWLELIRENTERIPIVLIGMKADLQRAIEQKEVVNFAKTHNLKAYFETSSKDDVNVTPAFEYIAKEMLDYVQQRVNKSA